MAPRALATRLLIVVVVSLVLAADYLPAPFPLTALDRPAIYETLRDRRERGAVCELPLGIRDGFGEHGSFDDRVLFYQTIHRRPLVGGFVARLPAGGHRGVRRRPAPRRLVALIGTRRPGRRGTTLPDRLLAADRLREIGIAFVVLNRQYSVTLARRVRGERAAAHADRPGGRALVVSGLSISGRPIGTGSHLGDSLSSQHLEYSGQVDAEGRRSAFVRRLSSACWAAVYLSPSGLPARRRRIASFRRLAFVASCLADSIQPIY